MGDLLAWGAFLIGLICGGYSWARLSGSKDATIGERATYVALSALVALSVFSNLAYFIWIVGLPLEMEVVRNGKMAEHWWLGPTTLVFTVLCWFGNTRNNGK